MLLSLPESLLLFALHDEKGTIRSSAYLSLGAALRGAVLAELVLAGDLRLSGDGWMKRVSSDSRSPLLTDALAAVAGVPNPSPIHTWDQALRDGLPDLKDRVTRVLLERGAIATDIIDREGLKDTTTYPTGDGRWERQMEQQVRAAIATGPRITRRMGSLVALIHVCDLWSAFRDPSLTAAGRSMGEWVIGRDPLSQAVRVAVHKAEGSYEG